MSPSGSCLYHTATSPGPLAVRPPKLSRRHDLCFLRPSGGLIPFCCRMYTCVAARRLLHSPTPTPSPLSGSLHAHAREHRSPAHDWLYPRSSCSRRPLSFPGSPLTSPSSETSFQRFCHPSPPVHSFLPLTALYRLVTSVSRARDLRASALGRTIEHYDFSVPGSFYIDDRDGQIIYKSIFTRGILRFLVKNKWFYSCDWHMSILLFKINASNIENSFIYIFTRNFCKILSIHALFILAKSNRINADDFLFGTRLDKNSRELITRGAAQASYFRLLRFFPASAQFSRSRAARVYTGPWTFFSSSCHATETSARIRQRQNHLKAGVSVSLQRNETTCGRGAEGRRGRKEEREKGARGAFVNAARSAFKPICMTRRQACTFELRSRARDFDKC